jgi:hypothetical protein
MMEILKIEDYKYSIIYTMNEGKAEVHKRKDDGTWQSLRNGKWIETKDFADIEKALKTNKK